MVRRRPKRRTGPSSRRTPLEEVIAHLRHAQSATVVAIAALRRQNCELDEDVALLLQRSVCDCLGNQLEKLDRAHLRPAVRMRGF